MTIGSNVVSHNNSSGIIESIFGRYKTRKSTNKLNGVTPYILFVPIYVQLINENQAQRFDFKAALEDKRIGEVETWARKNLSPNLVQLRTKQMKKAG